MGQTRAWVVLAFVGYAAAPLRAEPLNSGTVTLELANGAGEDRPMELELVLNQGKWGGKVWGRAVGLNFAHHHGSATAAGESAGPIRLTVALDVASDLVAPGGPARYELELERKEDEFSGTYTGVFIDDPVRGPVRGRIAEPRVRQRPGMAAVQPGEHPRLIFRKEEVADLRRRLNSPEGEGIRSMLTVRSPLRLASQVTDRHASWMAANWGALYQLTGDKAMADEARTVLMQETIAKAMPADRDDVQHAPRLLGIALTYDLCYDAWDEAFRRYLAEYVLYTADDLRRGLHEGMPMFAGTVDPTHWRHRNAVRMSCVGVAALAVRGDPNAEGDPLAGVEPVLEHAERDVVLYLRDGVTGAGAGLEGPMYKSIALANGILQFIHAERVALGRDLAHVNPFLLAGHVVTATDIGGQGYRFGLSSISVQASGRWPMGLGCVPDSFVPAMKWAFDRECGAEGRQHFDCAYPYQAAYAIRNYPFQVQAQTPGDGLPLAILDRVHGQCVFRNRWRDAGDVLAEVNFNCASLPGLNPRVAPQAGSLRIYGLGREWFSGLIGVPPGNPVYGGELLYAETGPNGQSFVGARLDPMYRQIERSSARSSPQRAQRTDLVKFIAPERPATKDAGVRCNRHFAADYSGAAGVAGLFVVVDEFPKGGKQRWYYPASTNRSAPAVHGDLAGTNLAWQFAVPAAANTRGYVEAQDLCFAVITLHSGPAPALRTEGAGASTRVRVGGQTVSFDGRRIAFAKEAP